MLILYLASGQEGVLNSKGGSYLKRDKGTKLLYACGSETHSFRPGTHCFIAVCLS